MSTAQATDFVEHWAVVDHLPNTTNGFSATLFKRLKSDPLTGAKAGELVFALRGTEQVGQDLFQADYMEIAGNGLAFRQIIDMYNYWQRLITPASEMVKQAVLVPTNPLTTPAGKLLVEGAPPPVYLNWTIDFDTVPGLGKVGLGDNLVAATGHSLGGHLATAFTRLFPAWGKQAITFNGAGYATGLIPGLSLTALANIPNLFSMLGGEADFRPADIVNLYGDKNAEFVTMDSFFGLMQPGAHDALFIEQDTVLSSWLGHGMGQMADSAAVYDLLIRIAGNLWNASSASVVSQFNPILEAASPTRNMSLENLVNALGDLFKAGAKVANTDDRDQLYKRVIAIREAVAGGTTLIPLANATRDTLVTEAKKSDATGLAYRYALKELNPFAVLGADYTQYNSELELYDPDTGEGNLTERCLQDRARFLAARNQINSGDLTGDVAPSYQGGSWQFEDKAREIQAWAGNPISAKSDSGRRQVTFGGSGADTFSGGDNGDFLYGGLGLDVLSGGKGDDYLEGQLGNDNLKGEAGRDTLLGGAGDDTLEGGEHADRLEGGLGSDTYLLKTTEPSNDVIYDIDGVGAIRLDDVPLDGGDPVSGVQGQWERDGVIYGFNPGADGVGELTIRSTAGLVTVLKFKNGQLGINLAGAANNNKPPINVDFNLKGDLTPIDFDLNKAGLQEHYDALGNIVVDPGLPEPGRGDWLFGSAGNDVIDGEAGSDYIESHGGDDKLMGADGADVLDAGAGADTLLGGAGSDILGGRAGDDIAYGAGEVPLATAFIQGEVQAASQQKGDWLDGADGKDTLIGDAGDDALTGGKDSDVMLGGGGDDNMRGDEVLDSANLSWTIKRQTESKPEQTIYKLDYVGVSLSRNGGGDDYLEGNEGDDVPAGGDRARIAPWHMARMGYMGNRVMTIGRMAAMRGKGFGGVDATKGEWKDVA